eukprot:TRINITY_DN12720_c0_g1_i1.p1 TRINITY_DN12720_c0_g1~~TRINITY_DN12720_c0_g1_i1.p1  ORF type:complete len:567 (+),score=93.86 TRINITY_DN12720_c0_g1_i1:103-1803(+)
MEVATAPIPPEMGGIDSGSEIDDTMFDLDDDDVEIDEDESLQQALKLVKYQEEQNAPPEVRPTITKQPEVIDDFVRNFLINSGLKETLEVFESELFEQKARQDSSGELNGTLESIVPDAYIQNSNLTEKVHQLSDALQDSKDLLKDMTTKYESLRKQRDYHKLRHSRVMQEKSQLQKDLKKLLIHNKTMEPMLTELRTKHEAIMKERVLIRLDRDKLQSRVQTMEETINKLEGTPKGLAAAPTASTKKKKTPGATWPNEEAIQVAKRNIIPNSVVGMSCRTLFKGHTMAVTGISCHPRKGVVATSSDDGSWKVWAVPTGDQIMSADGHKDWVSGIAFSPKSTHLATSSGDTTVKLWNILKAGCTHTFSEHTKSVWGVTWHDQGDFLASCSLDHTVRIWDTTIGKSKQTLRGHVDSVNTVQFQPGSNNLATGSGDKTVSVWDPRSGFCVHTFYGHSNAVNHISFSPKGDSIASVDADGMVIIWDMRNARERIKESCGPHPANSCAFEGSGKHVAIGSDDSLIYIMNTEESKISTLRGHEDAVQSVAFGADNGFLISGSSDGTARYWA